MKSLREYAAEIAKRAGKTLQSGEILAKVLTSNDDSSRHGVLIPNDAYAFFPELVIRDPGENASLAFNAFDVVSGKQKDHSWIYYHRYPERRITRVNALISDRSSEPRLVIFLHINHTDGTSGYYVDCTNSAGRGRFAPLFQLCFGDKVAPSDGVFVARPIDSGVFAADTVLSELLMGFDRVSAQGWLDTMRDGDTGIGFTFESLLGIKENNDRAADFKGIEIKCKGIKEGSIRAGKINLFQQGPEWSKKMTAKERIRQIGRINKEGVYACHSQVTTQSNNIGLSLAITREEQRIDLRKKVEAVGHWSFDVLERRLQEKHSRAVIVKASARTKEKKTQFRYEELIYCERPSIDRFIKLVGSRNIVFEFLMSEKPNGSVRNHGYPWRLVREEFLDNLFSFQIKLR